MKSLFLVVVLAMPAASHLIDEAQTAAQKEQELFSLIESSAYEKQLPEIVSPSTWSLLSLFGASYDAEAFSYPGDLMKPGREKLIHGYGTTARVAFVPSPHHPYTGLLSSGAPHGILRVSLAKPPGQEGLVPGLAIKFFIDSRPSVNVLAMPSLDPQQEKNIFSYPYSTDLKEPQWSIGKWFLENRFKSALSYVGMSGGNPRSLSLAQLTSQTSMGEVVSSPIDPFALVFLPTPELRELCDSSKDNDFRAQLNGKGNGIHLFDVFARGTPQSKLIHVGTLVATSNFIASSFGDTRLYFRHPPVHIPEALDEL